MFRKSTSVFLIKFLLTAILAGINLSAYCQVTVLEKTVYLLDDLYDLKVQKREEPHGDNVQEFYIIKAKQGDKESKIIELKSLEKVLLDTALGKVLLEATDDKYLENGTLKTGDKIIKDRFEAELKEISNSIYPEIMVAAIRVAEYEPVAGEIYIHDRIHAFTNSNNRSQYNQYRVKNLPLLVKESPDFIHLNTTIAARITSLTKFRNKIDSLEEDVNNIKLQIIDLRRNPIYANNKEKRNSADSTLNGSLKQFNSKISSSTETKLDDNISYILLYPEASFSYLKYDLNKLKKESKIRNKILNGINSNIVENLFLFSTMRNDIDELQDSLKVFQERAGLVQEDYNTLKQELSSKTDSLSESDTYKLTEIHKDNLNQRISELNLESSQKIDDLNKRMIALNSKLTRSLHKTLVVSEVEIEFNEGFLENITVRGLLNHDSNKNSNAPLEFTNNYPIGFSSKKDFDLLATTMLFEKRNRSSYNSLKIYIDDIFDYNYNLDLNTRDYSPRNGAYSFLPSERKQLTKVESSKILEAKVFTDLVGIDVEKPNGLIQTEVSRRININSRRYANYNVKRFIFFGKKVIFLGLKQENTNYGYFSYIEPVVAISKIEEDNRRLPLSNYTTIINGQIYSRSYVPMLRLREYQHLSVGTDLNLLLLDLPRVKSTFLLNAGLRFGRTALVDTTYRINEEGVIEANEIINEFGVSTLELFPEISWRIQPEKRYGFTFSDRLSFFNLLNPTILQVAEGSDFDREESINRKTWFNTFEILGFLDPNRLDNGRLFFRYRLFSNFKTPKTNFYQVQLGFSFYLLARNQPKSKSPVN